MTAQSKPQSIRKQVLAKAFVNAGRALGLTQEELGVVIGRDRSSFGRGIDPASKSGELALLLIRCYRSLFALVGGDESSMRHWMHTPNHYFHDTPSALIRSVNGLVSVVEYLDAMRT